MFAVIVIGAMIVIGFVGVIRFYTNPKNWVKGI
jgi:hypothetical protein